VSKTRVYRCTTQRGIHTFPKRIIREFVFEFDFDVNLLKKQVYGYRTNLTTNIALQKFFTKYLVKYLPYRESVQIKVVDFNKFYVYVRPTYRHFALRVHSDKIDEIRFQLYVK
jgi:hypothetical protein